MKSMQVDHPSLSPFEPVLRECTQMAFTTGLQALQTAGLVLADIKHDRAAHRRFLRGCHYGYDLAQRRVADEVIWMEHEAREAEKSLKCLRQAHNPEYKNLIEYVRVLRQRQLILRRLIDSILFSMLSPDEWVLRHFRLDDKIRGIDPGVLRKTARVATERNREERLRFSIISDLTTAVQIGDLVEIDRSTLTGRSWQVVELKTGKINKILSDLIEKKQGKVSDEDKTILRNSLGPKAVGQMNRMLAQQSRQKNLEILVMTEKGISPRFGVQTLVVPQIVEVDDYAAALDSACMRVHESGFAGARISRCLSLFVVSAKQPEATDFGAVKHSLYHMSNPSLACQLQHETAVFEELSSVGKIEPVIDLVQMNLRCMEGMPVFLWMQEERVMDLVMGRTRVFAYFDMESFFALAAKHGVRLDWIWSTPGDDMAKVVAQIPGGPPGAWGVRATLPDGEAQDLLSGFFGRVFTNLTSPKELITLIRRWPSDSKGFGISPWGGSIGPAIPA